MPQFFVQTNLYNSFVMYYYFDKFREFNFKFGSKSISNWPNNKPFNFILFKNIQLFQNSSSLRKLVSIGISIVICARHSFFFFFFSFVPLLNVCSTKVFKIQQSIYQSIFHLPYLHFSLFQTFCSPNNSSILFLFPYQIIKFKLTHFKISS